MKSYNIDHKIIKLEIKPEWKRKYDDSLALHLKYFREAAELLDVPEKQILEHDMSKSSFIEYRLYVRRFGGNIKENLFNIAWLNHIHKNPHHWQHWIIPEDKVLEMPEYYVLEMVADWLGSSKAYTGSFDMTEWLDTHLEKMILHENTRNKVLDLLKNKIPIPYIPSNF